MVLFLALCYAAGVWLVFFRLKLLPWDRKWITISVTVGVVGLIVLVLALNFSHPYSVDAVVMQKTTPIVPQVSGRIVELTVKSNQSVKKGDVLFRIDAVPYREKLNQADAALRQAEVQTTTAIQQAKQSVDAATAGTTAALAGVEAAKSTLSATQSSLALAEKRLGQYGGLANKGAGSKFQVEQGETNVEGLKAQIAAQGQQLAAATQQVAAARAQEQQAQISLRAAFETRDMSLAQARAARDGAQWSMNETVVTAPDDGYVTQLQLAVGAMASTTSASATMSFVRANPSPLVLATVMQQYVNVIKPGAEAEVALQVLPGRTFKASVVEIEKGTGTGQLAPTSTLVSDFQPRPVTRMYVVLKIEDDLKDVNIPIGSAGQLTIKGPSAKPLFIIRRIMIRMYTWMNYLFSGG
jgi:multidrug resistance efflux pump